MISKNYETVFSDDWINANIINLTHELVILKKVIPWQELTFKLSAYYSDHKGAIGKSIGTMVALEIIKHYKQLSDREVVKQVKENRYIQYFCNVADHELLTFIHHSSMTTFRQRLGVEGMKILETAVFERFQRAGVICPETALIDATVLESDIIYPNDVALLFNAFTKIAAFAKQHHIQLWWDNKEIKRLWREFNLKKRADREHWLTVFFLCFIPVLAIFENIVNEWSVSDNPKKHSKSLRQKERAEQLLRLLYLLGEQTVEKLEGKMVIANRIVSLDEVDARPIKKGKINPSCEFGSMLQMTFNRDGFMVTVENFIGYPSEKKLFPDTLNQFFDRLNVYPDIVVTDLGVRSRANFTVAAGKKVKHIFLGKSTDVDEEKQDYCQRARSANEGFIAVAKNLRGFGRSLYKGFSGDCVWSLLSQAAYNLKKFILLYQEESFSEESLIKLGLLG